MTTRSRICRLLMIGRAVKLGRGPCALGPALAAHKPCPFTERRRSEGPGHGPTWSSLLPLRCTAGCLGSRIPSQNILDLAFRVCFLVRASRQGCTTTAHVSKPELGVLDGGKVGCVGGAHRLACCHVCKRSFSRCGQNCLYRECPKNVCTF